MRRRGTDPEPVPIRETAIFKAVALEAANQRAEVERLSALLAQHGIRDDVQLDRLNEHQRGELT